MSRKLSLAMCGGCLSKMREIDRLKRIVERQRRYIRVLEKKLEVEPRTIHEAPFGVSTPSARLPFKPCSNEENRRRKGGAVPGHPGHGRTVPAEPEVVESVPAPSHCPDCGATMRMYRTRNRYVQDIVIQRTVRKRLVVQSSQCTACGKLVEAQVSGVFPRAKYTNRFLATVACQHYLGGRTQGDVGRQAQIGLGALNHAMHTVANRLEPCMRSLTGCFLADPLRFSDETSWREDGANRYAWLLSTLNVSIFLIGRTRAAAVPLELFAEMSQRGMIADGVLVVDRYAAYGRLPVKLQYCYAHLLRDVRKLESEFPAEAEVQRFCLSLGSLLAAAMKLRSETINDQAYYRRARILRQKITKVCAAPARHPGVQALQGIFRRNPHRLYHWAEDRRVPPDNNYSERSLRPLVIARKISFGSQAPNGARTRGILMSVMHSLAKQGYDPADRLTEALDQLAGNPKTDIAAFLFPTLSRPPPLRVDSSNMP